MSGDRIPYRAAATIDALVHLVQLSWPKVDQDIVHALTDDDLAALNGCFGANWGGGRAPWDGDHVCAATIREVADGTPETENKG